jgi:hypothetical protein
MRFAHLAWAIANRRLPHYEVARRTAMEPTRFSRCLTGRFDFAPHERKRLAELLGYDEQWLFQEVLPPRVCARREPPPALAEVSHG